MVKDREGGGEFNGFREGMARYLKPAMTCGNWCFGNRKLPSVNRLQWSGKRCVFTDLVLLNQPWPLKTSAMPESDSQTFLVLLYVVVGMLVLLLVSAFGIRRRLSRIERRLSEMHARREDSMDGPSPAEISGGGAFEMFLSEDAARKDLPKSEQFAEYRKWRQKQGLNWSNS